MQIQRLGLIADVRPSLDKKPNDSLEKWRIVVPSIPNNHIHVLALCSLKDRMVINTGVNHRAGLQMLLVLFPLFDGDTVFFQIVVGFETLDCLFGEIAVSVRDRQRQKTGSIRFKTARNLTASGDEPKQPSSPSASKPQ
jgi:hypothetical protein